MKSAVVLLALLLSLATAHAELFETRQADGIKSFSDRNAAPATATRHDVAIRHPLNAAALPGGWIATSDDGRVTTLELRPDGSFVFDQQGQRTRLYLCGEWTGGEERIDLTVKALKQQLVSGEIEQSVGSFAASATILTGQLDRMIVLFRGEQLVFDRAG